MNTDEALGLGIAAMKIRSHDLTLKMDDPKNLPLREQYQADIHKYRDAIERLELHREWVEEQ